MCPGGKAPVHSGSDTKSQSEVRNSRKEAKTGGRKAEGQAESEQKSMTGEETGSMTVSRGSMALQELRTSSAAGKKPLIGRGSRNMWNKENEMGMPEEPFHPPMFPPSARVTVSSERLTFSRTNTGYSSGASQCKMFPVKRRIHRSLLHATWRTCIPQAALVRKKPEFEHLETRAWQLMALEILRPPIAQPFGIFDWIVTE